MALGRPILLVGPNECHIADIMENKHVGWHVQHGNVEGTISAIVQEKFQQQQMIDGFTEIMLRGLSFQKEPVANLP